MNNPITRRVFLGTCAAGALTARRALADRANKPREVAWLAEVQRPKKHLAGEPPRLAPLLVDAEDKPITTVEAWEKRRARLRGHWEKFLGPLQVKRPVPKLEVLEEDQPEGCVRQLVRYEVEPGLPVEGYLLKPLAPKGRVPGVVAMHSTVNHTIRQPAGVEGRSEKAFGLKLAQRGMVAFCPRCFLWQGEGSYQDRVKAFQARHPESLGMAKMLFDAVRGVDVLVSLPEVDEQRIGAVGHSLGAKEALYLAAFDARVKAAVSSEGGVGARFSNWDAPWYLGPDIKNGRFTREHHELLALVAPRAFLLLGGDSADGDRSWPYITAAQQVYDLYDGPNRLGLFNHKQGHAVPPEAERRIYEWLETYL